LEHSHVETLLDVDIDFLELILVDVIEGVVHGIRYFLFSLPVSIYDNWTALFPVQSYADVKFLQLV
jgi:hypothetical protein